jgi:hypothetical protein
MSLNLSFDANTVQPASADFEPIPGGWYQFVIEKSELKPTKAGTGAMISLMAKVQGPTHANRVVFGNINYQNPNAQAQEIGQRQLSALCHSIGVLNLNNVGQLCGIPFEGRIKITAPTYNVKGDVNSGILYEARNEFMGFRAIGAGTAGAGSAPAASAPKAAPAVKAAPAAPAVAAKVAPVLQEPATVAATADIDPAILAAAMAQIAAQNAAATVATAQPNGGEATATTEQPW